MLLRTSVYPRSWLMTAVLAIALLVGCSGSGGSGGGSGGDGSGGGSSGGSGGTGGGTGMESIGPDGGEITSRDGRLTLIIPEGALDEPTEITIEALEVRDLGDEFEELVDTLGETMAYELGPDGLEFNEPITARIASELPLVQDDDSLALHLGLMFTSDGEEVALLDNLRVELDEDDDTTSVSGELAHFSPLVDTVDQLGSSIQFQVFGVPEELEVGESFVAQVTVIAPDEGDGPLQVVAPVSYEDRSTSPIEAAFSPTSAELDETARSVYQGAFEYTCADEGSDLYAARMTAGVHITLDSDELVAAETWSNLHRLVECVPEATPAAVDLRVRTFGSGSVKSEPEGIDCDQCEEQTAAFDADTEITLTASPAQGSEFEGWNGELETADDVIYLAEECGDNPVCTFTLESDALVDVYFDTPVATLSVGKSGDGEGSVITDAEGIDCGPTCVDDQEADFALGTEVTLTATPEDGSVFVAWHPADGSSAEGECGTDPVCSFTLDSDFTYVEAEFSRVYWSLDGPAEFLAVVRELGGEYDEVRAFDAEGNFATIAPPGSDIAAAVSKNGEMVLVSYLATVNGDTVLGTVPSAGGTFRVISGLEARDFVANGQALISPNGAVVVWRNASYSEVWAASSDGTELHRMTTSLAFSSGGPAFSFKVSTDGTRIFWRQQRDGADDVDELWESSFPPTSDSARMVSDELQGRFVQEDFFFVADHLVFLEYLVDTDQMQVRSLPNGAELAEAIVLARAEPGEDLDLDVLDEDGKVVISRPDGTAYETIVTSPDVPMDDPGQARFSDVGNTSNGNRGNLIVSPDGTKLAHSTGDSIASSVVVREMDTGGEIGRTEALNVGVSGLDFGFSHLDIMWIRSVNVFLLELINLSLSSAWLPLAPPEGQSVKRVLGAVQNEDGEHCTAITTGDSSFESEEIHAVKSNDASPCVDTDTKVAEVEGNITQVVPTRSGARAVRVTEPGIHRGAMFGSPILRPWSFGIASDLEAMTMLLFGENTLRRADIAPE